MLVLSAEDRRKNPPPVQQTRPARHVSHQVFHKKSIGIVGIFLSLQIVEHFEKVAELKPDALRLIDLGAAYLLLARADDAAAAFERASLRHDLDIQARQYAATRAAALQAK